MGSRAGRAEGRARGKGAVSGRAGAGGRDTARQGRAEGRAGQGRAANQGRVLSPQLGGLYLQ